MRVKIRDNFMVDAQQYKKGVPHPAVQVVVGKYGIPTTVVNTVQGLIDISPNDWVVTFLGHGNIVMRPGVFAQVFEEWHEAPNRQREPERASSGVGPAGAGLADGEAPPVQVESSGLLRSVRPDSPAPDQGGPAHSGQVEPVPPQGPSGDSGLSRPTGSDPGGVGMGRPGWLAVPPPIIPGGYEATDPHAYKQKAIKAQRDIDNLEARVKAGEEAERMRRSKAGMEWTPEEKARYKELMKIAEPQ